MPKTRCLFGPSSRGKKKGKNEHSQGEERLTLPTFHPTLDSIEQEEANRDHLPPSSSSCNHDTTHLRPGMTCTTLTLPHPRPRTLFDRHKGIAAPKSRPNSYKFILRKLGLLAKEFEDKIDQDIDELFQEIQNEQRQTLLETLPYERVLSKANCRSLFTVPPAGLLLSIYRWAHGLSGPVLSSNDVASSSHASHPNDE